jgi:hypothetical protein
VLTFTPLNPVDPAAIRVVELPAALLRVQSRFLVLIGLRQFGFLLLLSRLFRGTVARPGHGTAAHPFKSHFLPVDKNRLRACPPIAPVTLTVGRSGDSPSRKR